MEKKQKKKQAKTNTCDLSKIEIVHTKLNWQQQWRHTKINIYQSDPLWIVFYNKVKTIIIIKKKSMW